MENCCGGVTRRALLRASLLAAGAWAVGPLASQAAVAAEKAVKKGGNGLRAAEEALRGLIQRYASVKDNPWAVMHGIRAMGKGFSLDEGPATDYLCAHFLKEKEVGGQRYLYMPLEGHANTFLKTLLEAGLPMDHAIMAAGRRRTVGDLVTSAKKLFSFTPDLSPLNNSRDELAWSIIAFAITTQPAGDVWENAEGRKIKFRDVVAAAFSTAELASADFQKAMREGVMPAWKDRIANLTCGGTHLIYSLAVAVRYGHLGEEGRRRLAGQLELLIWRLKADLYLADRYYELVAQAYVNNDFRKLYELDARLKFLGHSMEIFSYVTLFRLFSPNRVQQVEIRTATEKLTETIQVLANGDFASIRQQRLKLYNLLIGDACHAYHGLRMVRGVNQV